MNTALFQQEMKNIEEYAQTLCDTLEENFKQDSIASYKRMAMTDSGYATKRLEEIENGTANLYKFVVQKGRKYLKIINQQYDDMGPNPSYEYRNGSVHAFIDRETGDVYKPASWAKPAKHVRYNLLERSDRNFLFDYRNVGWAGGYLYMR
mgnify:FL=1|tara:strand:- start:1198 stop:1647 length:450 start_codon:yes stop_codon:yes gene_type:complete